MILPKVHARLSRARWLKPALFALCLVPLASLALRFTEPAGLGANPIEAVIRNLGDWALRFLLLALAITPLRKQTGWTVIGRQRRMIGLFAFFYVTLHLTAYLWLDQGLDLDDIWADIVKRPYITIGIAAFVLLVPLAITSAHGIARRLGPRRWRTLHKLVYGIGILGVVHYLLLVKADIREPLVYGAILAALLLYRVVGALRPRPARPAPLKTVPG